MKIEDNKMSKDFEFVERKLSDTRNIFQKLKRRGLSAALTTLFVSAPFLITLLYGFYKAVEQLTFVTQVLKKETPTTIMLPSFNLISFSK